VSADLRVLPLTACVSIREIATTVIPKTAKMVKISRPTAAMKAVLKVSRSALVDFRALAPARICDERSERTGWRAKRANGLAGEASKLSLSPIVQSHLIDVNAAALVLIKLFESDMKIWRER
jgi:hypothetical protein